MAKETIKVRVTATVEVDYVAWANLYGIAVAQVRDDVRNYVTGALQDTAAQEAGAITAVVIRTNSVR